MAKLIDALDFYPDKWSENEKARITIWVILSVILLLVAVLSWGNFYYFPDKFDRQSIAIDSLTAKIKSLSYNDSVRTQIDIERKKAMVEWRASFERDEARKKLWDQRFKKDTTKN